MSKTTDPRWQRRRLEVMQRDNWTCQRCGAKEKQLEVHHTVYYEKTAYHEYPDDCLITLCRDCHQYETIHWSKPMLILGDAIRRSGMLSDEVYELAGYHRSKKHKRVNQ